MSTKRPSVSTISELIQKYTNSDWDKLVEISENLDEIIRQSGLTLGVDYSENGFPQDNLDDLLRELTATVKQNQLAADTISAINETIANNSAIFQPILETAIFYATTDVKDALWVVNENDMASNSISKVPTQKSVRAFVENLIGNATSFQGEYDASTNTPNLDSRALPVLGTVKKADNWVVGTTGTFFGVAISKGDQIKALINDPTLITDWIIISNALDANTIASLYEGLPDVNRFDDSAVLKLAGIEPGATEDQDASEVPFDDTGLSITATNVQQAIVETLNIAGQIQVDIIDGTTYIADPSRGGKLLSVTDVNYLFSKGGKADGVYLNPASTVVSTTTGYRLPKNATLIGINIEGKNNPTKEFQIQKNAVSLGTLNLVDGVYKDFTLNIDFDEEDIVQIYITNIDSDLRDTLQLYTLSGEGK